MNETGLLPRVLVEASGKQLSKATQEWWSLHSQVAYTEEQFDNANGLNVQGSHCGDVSGIDELETNKCWVLGMPKGITFSQLHGTFIQS